MLGSAIFVSAFVVHVRLKAFEKKFVTVQEEAEKRGRGRGLRRRLSLSLSHQPTTSPNLPRMNSDTGSGERPVPVDAVDGDTANVVASDESSPTPQDSIASRSHAPGTESHRAKSEISEPMDDRDENIVPETSSQTEGKAGKDDGNPDSNSQDPSQNHITFHQNTVFRLPSPDTRNSNNHHRFFAMQGVGARPTSSLRRVSESGRRPSYADVAGPADGRERKYSWELGFIGRNSQFHHLTEDERNMLGGVEYKAIRFLAYVVPLYFVMWQALGCIGLGAYVANNRPSVARDNGLNPFWVGAFNAVSAFNNSGMSLLDANMVAFQTSVYMLITMSLLILAGNTCYPVFLRLIVWSIRKLMPNNKRWQDHRATLKFLLDHPRRCYTNLFPSEHTWWLLFAVVCLNGIDWAAFEILNIGNSQINVLPTGIRVIDGLFQAFAVRSGGFYVVPIPSIRISLQVLYVLMMYVSVYPVVITIRNSNVYEERSLGIYADDPGFNPNNPSNDPDLKWRGRFARTLKRQLTNERSPRQSTRSYFVRQQLRAQLSHDLWWICLAVFLIMIVESSQFERDPSTFSVFNVIFEVVSAYSCVGISVGLPDQAYSFCGAWRTLSKLILCAVMLRGRHRGLPVAIDKAVLLPREKLHHAEEEDAQIRRERSLSQGNNIAYD